MSGFRALLLPLGLSAVLLLLPAAIGAEGGAPSLTGRERKAISVDSDRMEADGEKKLVVFRGNVVAEEAFLLCSDELYIYYTDTNEVKDIVARGGVRVFHGDKVASAAEVRYNRDDGSLLFTGAPKVSQCGDIISGHSISYNIDTGSALVEANEGERVRAVIIPDKECPEVKAVEKDICRGAR